MITIRRRNDACASAMSRRIFAPIARIALFTVPLLSHHDRSKFEIFCYSSVAAPDVTTARIQTHADVWRDVTRLKDAEVAQRIRQDKIDILVDLTLHMAACRLLIFARKPAPIQATWLGYPGTTGLDAIDYRLTDPQLDPPGQDEEVTQGDTDDARIGTRQKFYSERSVRLPDCFWCYDPCGAADIERASMPDPNPLPALATGWVTFGCLNNFAKVSDQSLDLWAKVLDAIPGSQLLMAAAPGSHRERVLRKLGGERVQFVARQQRLQYMETYHKIDLCLDPLPCNGGTTSLDALWMGVPMVTQVGRTVVGRAGWTLLHNLGLMDLVSRTDDEFVQKTVDLAKDLDRLAGLRATLRGRMEQSPLMDGARFARNVEAAYRQMWQAWCGSRPATAVGGPPMVEQSGPYTQEIQQLFKDGLAHLNAGRFEEAETAYRRILTQRPNVPEVHFNLGIVLLRQRKTDEAIAACRAALALRPDYQEAWNNLGVILRESNRSAEAVPAYRQSLELRPDIHKTWTNLALAMQDTGQLDEAIACYDRAIALQPDDAGISSSRLHIHHYHPAFDAAAIFRELSRWNQRFARPLAGEIRGHDNDRSPSRRLRIGYVSSDFRVHCQTLFTTPLLTNHDRQAFEIFCYSSVNTSDAVTAKLHSHVDGWREIIRISDAAAPNWSGKTKSTSLVDLSLHTAGKSHYMLFARKPAPVQVTWLGYPGSTGMDAIDYRLTDSRLDPPSNDAASTQFATKEDYYSERSVRLPDSYWCYDPYGFEAVRGPDLPEPGPLPALAAGHVTFGCLNTFWKVSDQTLALWSRVMAALPNSQLLMFAAPGPHRDLVVKKLGVAPDRVRFIGFQPWRQYLATYQQIDLCLDTLPFSGGTTSLDSLWMGVPVVTLIGRTIVGRAGSSHLYNLGLMEFIADSEDQFVNHAVQWGGDLPRLGELRASLRQRMERSPLMDGRRFARNMEAAYRRMWQAWCEARALEFAPLPPFGGGRRVKKSYSRRVRAWRTNDPRFDILFSWQGSTPMWSTPSPGGKIFRHPLPAPEGGERRKETRSWLKSPINFRPSSSNGLPGA